MPLVNVEIVGGRDPVPATLAGELADALGGIFASPPGTTWVRVRALAREAYAENGVNLPLGTEAVFVAITKRTLPATNELAAEAARVSAAVGKLCDRPADRVHVIYEPPGAGRIAFGGTLVM